jgi:biotin transport system substrate-specific component
VSLPETAVLAAAFIPGDVVKAVLATAVASGVHRALPDLLGARGGPPVPTDRLAG